MNKILILASIVLFTFSCIKNTESQETIQKPKKITPPIEIISSTFLGNETRNFYGDSLPDRLDTIWQFYLGEGLSPAYGKNKIWKGAGWTGQPLLVLEYGHPYIIQGAFDYGLHKIDAITGKEIWNYKFDDILKGTGTLWYNKNGKDSTEQYVIIQGSRRGWNKKINSKYCWSLRAVSYYTGKELWRHNSVRTWSYSRDVDGSALVINDTGYLALENGLFTVFNPDYRFGIKVDSFFSPKVYKEIKYFTNHDTVVHGHDIVSESSPTYLGDHIYTASGTGWIYGYNIKKGKNDWQMYIGSDLDGSMPVTSDNCLLVPIEKQYIKGNGGLMKVDPNKNPDSSVVWFLPVDSIKWIHWEGGIIGSVTINDKTKKEDEPFLATFIDCKGDLYVVDYMHVREDTLVWSPNKETKYHPPVVLAKIKAHATISTPIIVKNRIFEASDKGLFLYQFSYKNKKFDIKKIAFVPEMSCDATPITWNGRIYIASTNGYLYCLGKKD